MFGYLWESWRTEPKLTEAELMRKRADTSLIAKIDSEIKESADNGCYYYIVCLPCKETTLDEYYKNKGYEVKTWTKDNNNIVMGISW